MPPGTVSLPPPWAACATASPLFLRSSSLYPNWTSPGTIWGHYLSSYHRYLGEEVGPHLTTTAFQAVIESDMVSLESSPDTFKFFKGNGRDVPYPKPLAPAHCDWQNRNATGELSASVKEVPSWAPRSGESKRCLLCGARHQERRPGHWPAGEQAWNTDANSLVRGGTGCPEKLWCPIPGGTQGQVGWGPGQPELMGGSPAHCRGWSSMEFSLFQLKPFCGSVSVS